MIIAINYLPNLSGLSKSQSRQTEDVTTLSSRLTQDNWSRLQLYHDLLERKHKKENTQKLTITTSNEYANST